MYTLEGVSSVANFITAYLESQSNRDSRFLICSVCLVSKINVLTFIRMMNINTYIKALHVSWLRRIIIVQIMPPGVQFQILILENY